MSLASRTRAGALPVALAVLLGAALVGSSQLTANSAPDPLKFSADEQAIRGVIVNSYLNGAFNDQDTVAMATGFHKDFAIFSAREDELRRYEIAAWIDGIRKRKAAPKFDPDSTRMDGRIVSLDVTGGAASVKIELRRQGELVYTDYLSFLKFKSGWRIAAKVYHHHPG